MTKTQLRLLEKGVRSLAPTTNTNSASASASASASFDLASPSAAAKVPWKKVAEYIVAHGGSYHFGNSTCRKRWDKLVREQAARGRSMREGFFGVEEGEDRDVGVVMEGDGVGDGGDGLTE